MRIATRSRSAATILDLHGRFEFESRQLFNQAAQTVIEGPSTHLVLNLAHVSAVDSTALRLMMLTFREFKRRDKRMTLLYPQPAIKKILEATRMNIIIPVKESENAIFVEAAVTRALATEPPSS